MPQATKAANAKKAAAATIPQALPPLELHACMGLNACKGHGWSGTNDCAGTGDCATNRHPCHTLNNCRGQGGCGLFGTTQEFCTPGDNACAFQGSCGTPILASRYITQGPNKGTSVWLLARKLFEARMTKAKRTVGPPPAGQEYGPTNEYAAKLGAGQSCGQSGERYCSYAFGKAEREKERLARQAAFAKASARHLPETMKNCDCE
jgi:hypothetical protein